jgi:FkbM family methyltransferase
MPDMDFIRSVGTLKWFTRFSSLQFRKRVLRQDSRFRVPTGTWMILPRHSGNSSEVYVTNGDIDWGAEALFAEFADSSRDFLDIGAHIGYYSAYLSNRVRGVYAFEPDPRNLPSLYRNASLAGNVEVVEMAVSSADGEARFHKGAASEVSSLVGGPEDGSYIDVRVTTVDSFAATKPQISVVLIKIDAEENDLEVLRGMEKLAARDQPLILAECGYEAGVRELCARWKYRIFAFTRDRATLKTNFREFDSVELEKAWYKMLFLVPPHLAETFSRRVR